MNPVVIVHLLVAVIVLVAAVPLIRRQVKMNHWYGVRIPAAFVSETAWYDINAYGGRLLWRWGWAIMITALGGAVLERNYWVAYDWTSLVISMGGLAWVMLKIFRYPRR